jgi:hypothetical protein
VTKIIHLHPEEIITKETQSIPSQILASKSISSIEGDSEEKKAINQNSTGKKETEKMNQNFVDWPSEEVKSLVGPFSGRPLQFLFRILGKVIQSRTFDADIIRSICKVLNLF